KKAPAKKAPARKAPGGSAAPSAVEATRSPTGSSRRARARLSAMPDVPSPDAAVDAAVGPAPTAPSTPVSGQNGADETPTAAVTPPEPAAAPQPQAEPDATENHAATAAQLAAELPVPDEAS